MQFVKVAAATVNQTPLAWESNLEHIKQAIDIARQQNVSILCFPELCISGYGCADAFHSRGVQKTALQMLLQLVDYTEGIAVAVGVPVNYSGGLFNTACLIADKKILGFVGKQHLAGDGIHYEPRWFKAWPDGIVAEIELDGKTYPLGDIIFDVGGIRIGFEICEDAWVADRPGARCAARGADIILNPSASHFSFGKHAVRRQFAVEGSRAFKVTYVYANLLGNEAGRAIYDGDLMIATNGKLAGVGQRFSFEPVGLTTATVDVDLTRTARSRSGSFEPELDGDESDVFHVNFTYPPCAPESTELPALKQRDPNLVKLEEFTRIISLGLFDYMRKSHSRGFVISLSGGVDSTAAAVLCAIMVELAVEELGIDLFCEKIGNFLQPPPKDTNEICQRLITTAYQATRNSSDTTRQAAPMVAAAIHSTHMELDVDGIVDAYTEMISGQLRRDLTWETDDLALQNIQARVRSPSVWMLANIKNALLLSTSNRSEVAVGYATMDGDTSGGLAPLAGIDKHFLQEWLRWIETTGPRGLGPIPHVKYVNQQQPTAELRPQGESQTDEGDLMPYEILDAIERYAIRDKLMPLEIHTHLTSDYGSIDSVQLGEWVIRFFQLFCRNQWKRERFAPSFHVDDESLDPKTWLRFPILSGGYAYEIGELKKALDKLSD